MYFLSNGTRSVITIRVRFSKKIVEDHAIKPSETLELTDKEYQLVEGDKTQCDVLTFLNVEHVNDELADTNVEINELISSALLSLGRGTPVSLPPDQANQKGVSLEISSSDHVHNIPTATPVNIVPDSSTQQGTAPSFARSDHQHKIDTAAPTNNLTGSTANNKGTSTNFSRSDHAHNIETGVPASVQPDFPNAEGTSAAMARANHVHRIATAAPANNLTGSTSNVRGNALTFSRSDHEHNISTGAPSNIGTANAEGTSAAMARADHVHSHGNLAGGSLHAEATISTSGFMSASDKSKLDTLAFDRELKAGTVAAVGFAGNPKKFTVVFATAMPDLNYSITVIGADARTWSYETKTAAGFTINANANLALAGEVSWKAINNGETAE